MKQRNEGGFIFPFHVLAFVVAVTVAGGLIGLGIKYKSFFNEAAHLRNWDTAMLASAKKTADVSNGFLSSLASSLGQSYKAYWTYQRDKGPQFKQQRILLLENYARNLNRIIAQDTDSDVVRTLNFGLNVNPDPLYRTYHVKLVNSRIFDPNHVAGINPRSRYASTLVDNKLASEVNPNSFLEIQKFLVGDKINIDYLLLDRVLDTSAFKTAAGYLPNARALPIDTIATNPEFFGLDVRHQFYHDGNELGFHSLVNGLKVNFVSRKENPKKEENGEVQYQEVEKTAVAQLRADTSIDPCFIDPSLPECNPCLVDPLLPQCDPCSTREGAEFPLCCSRYPDHPLCDTCLPPNIPDFPRCCNNYPERAECDECANNPQFPQCCHRYPSNSACIGAAGDGIDTAHGFDDLELVVRHTFSVESLKDNRFEFHYVEGRAIDATNPLYVVNKDGGFSSVHAIQASDGGIDLDIAYGRGFDDVPASNADPVHIGSFAQAPTRNNVNTFEVTHPSNQKVIARARRRYGLLTNNLVINGINIAANAVIEGRLNIENRRATSYVKHKFEYINIYDPVDGAFITRIKPRDYDQLSNQFLNFFEAPNNTNPVGKGSGSLKAQFTTAELFPLINSSQDRVLAWNRIQAFINEDYQANINKNGKGFGKSIADRLNVNYTGLVIESQIFDGSLEIIDKAIAEFGTQAQIQDYLEAHYKSGDNRRVNTIKELLVELVEREIKAGVKRGSFSNEDIANAHMKALNELSSIASGGHHEVVDMVMKVYQENQSVIKKQSTSFSNQALTLYNTQLAALHALGIADSEVDRLELDVKGDIDELEQEIQDLTDIYGEDSLEVLRLQVQLDTLLEDYAGLQDAKDEKKFRQGKYNEARGNFERHIGI